MSIFYFRRYLYTCINIHFTYHYIDAAAGDTEESVVLEPEDYTNKTLSVPIRDRFEYGSNFQQTNY